MDKLTRIAMNLSENEIKQLLKLKKVGGKKLALLRAKRIKLRAALAILDRKIDLLEKNDDGMVAAPKRGRKGATKRGRKTKVVASGKVAKKTVAATKLGRRGGKSSVKAKVVKMAKDVGKRGGRKSKWSRTGLSAAIRDVFADNNETLRSSDILQRLKAKGTTISNPAVIRRKVASILATQKKKFIMVDRGLYRRID